MKVDWVARKGQVREVQERRITKADWEGIGVTDQDTVSWSAQNKWTVDGEGLSKGAVDHLHTDPEMVFHDA